MTARPMQPPTGRVILFERAGCHLCEQAAQVLDDVLGTGPYQRVDIDREDDLIVRYGFRVPVISVDSVDRLEAPITATELRALLTSLGEAL
jgi:hypothetical protein